MDVTPQEAKEGIYSKHMHIHTHVHTPMVPCKSHTGWDPVSVTLKVSSVLASQAPGSTASFINSRVLKRLERHFI